MDQAQKTIQKKRCSVREHKLQKLREYSNPRFEYHKKVNYIEGNIEKDIRYYDESNTAMRQMTSYKKQFKKITDSNIAKTPMSARSNR